MDIKSLLLISETVPVRVDKKLADGEEHALYFKAKKDVELQTFLGIERRAVGTDDEASDLARTKRRAKFIASSLCEESGEPSMTEDEAMLIPGQLKQELCSLIIDVSTKTPITGKS